MTEKISPDEITIRTKLQPGDIGYITYLHGSLYQREYDYGIEFETYVAAGLNEFYAQYDETKDRAWIAEHHGKIVGFLLLMHRGDAAQLRYFILEPAYRGLGLGKMLMDLFMEHFQNTGFRSAYLWTTQELSAAAHLYKKYGFRLTEEKESVAFGKRVTEQRYERESSIVNRQSSIVNRECTLL
jgi:ribosomal protein S18 acetylase RimI-like enzyme